MTFESIGIDRLRIGRDGDGVTTLVAGFGCPLSCRYCLNAHCKNRKYAEKYSPDELFDAVKLDSLYFQATGGGITFGGGEPLLQADFIAEFVRMVREKRLGWKFFIETSLAVRCALHELMPLFDGWIVDVKDMNPEIYRAYTGHENALTLENLNTLREVAERVTVRIPLIEGYNTDSDRNASEAALRKLGYRNFDRFSYTIREN